ncbi:MAG: NAD+ synthase, partial [Phycisphaerales bacterium]
MRIALAQTNPIVGDLEGNAAKIRAFIGRGREAGADLVVFPELSVLGYPPKDLLLKRALVQRNREVVADLARECRGVAALIGYADLNQVATGRPLRNSAALCANGQIVSVHHKMLLPTYDVFDEQRYFEPGERPHLARLVGAGDRPVNLGITICEDLWNEERIWGRPIYTQNPIRELVEAGADVLVNMAASPFWLSKPASRTEIFRPQVAQHRKPLLFVNQVGGNDELIFDGSSAAFGTDGRTVARAKSFVEDLLLVDLDRPESLRAESSPGPDEEVLQALILGTHDYVTKSGFRDVVLGLSGGVDSALTAAIAAEALGPERVHGVAMPSRYSSEHSTQDAEQLARALGIDYRVVTIGRLHDAYEAELAPHFADRGPDVTEENIQARIRGSILMALSNKFGWLLLTTGNKSELAVGYCTLYGDMCGGLAVIADVPKMMVYRLSELVNRRAGRELIPQRTITKVPSAELRPDQCDQDSLPPYELLDAILYRYVEQEQPFEEIAAALAGQPGFSEQILR